MLLNIRMIGSFSLHKNSSRKTWELKLGDTVDYSRFRELDQFLAFARSIITPANATEKSQTTKTQTKKKTSALRTVCSCAHCAKRTIYYILRS